MADIDDFFAKKDKKKAAKKSAKPASSDDGSTSAVSGSKIGTSSIRTTILKDDDEWVQPEEKVVDYTGLRIHDLSIADQAEDEASEEADESQPTKKAGKKTWAPTKSSGRHVRHITGVPCAATRRHGCRPADPARHEEFPGCQKRISWRRTVAARRASAAHEPLLGVFEPVKLFITGCMYTGCISSLRYLSWWQAAGVPGSNQVPLQFRSCPGGSRPKSAAVLSAMCGCWVRYDFLPPRLVNRDDIVFFVPPDLQRKRRDLL